MRHLLAILAALALALSAGPAAAQTPAVSSSGLKAGPIGAPVNGVQNYILLAQIQLWGVKGDQYDCGQLECHGVGDPAFLVTGEPVTLLDPAGAVLTAGTLKQVPSTEVGEISFEFVARAPDESAYTLQLKDGPSIAVTKAELERDGWAVRRTFGAAPAAPPRTGPASPLDSPAGDAALGPVAGTGAIRIAAEVHLRGAEGEQFHCQGDLTGCAGLGKYAAIVNGAPALIYDASGLLLLGRGELALDPARSTEHELVFRAVVTAPDETAYNVKVADRPQLPVTRADFAAANWTFTLTLGPASTS
jgi:hypothetical protein